MKKIVIKLSFLSLLALTSVACSSDDDTDNGSGATVEKSAVIENYADLVLQNYLDAFSGAVALENSLNKFVENPIKENFDIAKNAWIASRESYGQTEAFRFANGPIDTGDEPEGLLNAWPLDENYVDYVEGLDDSGIINDLVNYPTIDIETLEGLNGQGGEENVSVGYHAIEFLLWGQDLTDPLDKLPGQRPFTDFVDDGTSANQDRRRTYLVVCAELLKNNLQSLIDEWKEGGAYRDTFLALDEDEALKNIITGISTLSKSELAGERISVAYQNKDQEDEHSCFSDNTHRDIRLNLQGIANVYRGSYSTSIDGASLEDLVTQADPTVGAKITALLAAAEVAVEATAIPFDFAISDDSERPAVIASVLALQDLGDSFVEGGTAIGIAASSELPD
ncbi:imelysin family protein [Aquimarina addita]|uniref:Imelysin family protein n=1 Tax=Aquimarina addita TaxID=870485 RepID=A0ABP6UJL1_9FLAO